MIFVLFASIVGLIVFLVRALVFNKIYQDKVYRGISSGWLIFLIPLVWGVVAILGAAGIDIGMLAMPALVVIVTFFVIANRHIYSMWICLLGVLLNGLVIVVNGGYMPLSPMAASFTGLEYVNGEIISSKGIYLAEPALELLTDRLIVAIPFMGYVYHWMLSIGDVVMMIGIFFFVATEIGDERLWKKN